MSNADKTREKLLSSMRKTKAGSEEKEKGAETGKSPEPAKTTAKPGTAGKPAKSAPEKGKPQAPRPKESHADPYQSGGRVWPD